MRKNDKSVFWFRVGYAIILIVLTCCYVFGNVIQSWASWILGLLYGFSFNETVMSFKRRPKVNNKAFYVRLFNIFVLVVLALFYAFTDVIEIWRNWTSGAAYGLAISGLLWTLERWQRR